eukprot:comp23817_c0_seq2/m.41480 comp23817_c0_seq2/g.41480  ORF comp23817_c0_seq2/g.41480 comp23817_c0_seq2/m.41480 type:complete len:239 (-) comp23817_c0_seq2:388-1104(-)
MANFYIPPQGDSISNMDSRIQELEARIALLSSMVLSPNRGGAMDRSCDPGPIGMVGFAMATIMLGYAKAGLVEAESASLLTCWGFMMGGVVQLVAGIWEQQRGGIFGCWAFTAFGCSWMATGFFNTLVAAHVLTPPGPKGDMAKAGLWFVFALMLTVLSFRVSTYHIPMLASVTLIFLCEFLAVAFESTVLMHAAGYFAIIAGSMAFLLAFAINVNDMWGRRIFNYGAYGSHSAEDKC